MSAFDNVTRFISRMRTGGSATVEVRGATRQHMERSRQLALDTLRTPPSYASNLISYTTYDESGVPTATYRRFQWGVDGFPDGDPETTDPDYATGWIMT